MEKSVPKPLLIEARYTFQVAEPSSDLGFRQFAVRAVRSKGELQLTIDILGAVDGEVLEGLEANFPAMMTTAVDRVRSLVTPAELDDELP